MKDFDIIVFKNKKFSDILKDIHDNSKEKENQISTLIQELRPMIKGVGEATIIVPLLAKYIEMGIKNDDNLIKLAGIIQRVAQAKDNGDEQILLSEAEKKQLFDAVNKNEK
jgi:hypothetical protein